MFITIYGLNWMKVVDEDMTRNCSRNHLDLIAGNMCSVIELLTTGTHFLHIVRVGEFGEKMGECRELTRNT